MCNKIICSSPVGHNEFNPSDYFRFILINPSNESFYHDSWAGFSESDRFKEKNVKQSINALYHATYPLSRRNLKWAHNNRMGLTEAIGKLLRCCGRSYVLFFRFAH